MPVANGGCVCAAEMQVAVCCGDASRSVLTRGQRRGEP